MMTEWVMRICALSMAAALTDMIAGDGPFRKELWWLTGLIMWELLIGAIADRWGAI